MSDSDNVLPEDELANMIKEAAEKQASTTGDEADTADYLPVIHNENLSEAEVKNLQEQHAAYVKALNEEFERKTAVEPENVDQHMKDFFKANVHYAAAQVVHLSMHADSETVRLSASKLIITEARQAEEAAKDPMKAIIEGLQNNDKKKQPENKEA